MESLNHTLVKVCILSAGLQSPDDEAGRRIRSAIRVHFSPFSFHLSYSSSLPTFSLFTFLLLTLHFSSRSYHPSFRVCFSVDIFPFSLPHFRLLALFPTSSVIYRERDNLVRVVLVVGALEQDLSCPICSSVAFH